MICSAKFSGMLDTDGMPNFLKLYPRAEIPKVASLNYFLKANNLESKEDMPYKRMFDIHARSQQLKRANILCHCNSTEVCECCNSTLYRIDCVEHEEYENDDPRRYTKILHDDIANVCCACGKRERNLCDMELSCFKIAVKL